MSCMFCDSSEHLTQNCDKYVTDESRNRYLFSNNTCKQCKSSWNKYFTYCIKCEPETKCLTCFSRQHHTFFCPVRCENPPKWFVPKIDKNLLNRFFHMVCDDPLEQYSLVISIPEASEFIKLKPVKVFKRINISENNDYSLKYLPKAGILVLDGEIRIHKSALDGIDISFDSSMPGYSNFVKAISKKELFLKPKYITLKRVIISVQDFFYLLSPITQIIACTKLTFTSEIMFVDVLKKSPILEELSFFKTKIKVSDTWVEDLQLYGRKLIKLCVNIENINFNVKVLADIIKEKKMQISLFLDNVYPPKAVYNILMSEKFSTYFSSPSSTIPSANYFLHFQNPYNFYLKPL